MADFLDLYGARLDRELGSADRDALFTTARRKAAINEAQLEWVKQTESFTRQVSITMVDDTQEYDLEAVGILSAQDFLWIAAQGAEYAWTDANGDVTYLSGETFPRRDVPVLNRHEPGWRNVEAVSLPTSYYLREDGGTTMLGLYPKPAIEVTESAVVTLPYVAKPTDMSADADVPFTVSSNPKTVLVPWHQALVHYAAALLEPLRKGYQAEQRQRGLFAGLVADYLQRQRPKGGHDVMVAHNYYRAARQSALRPLDPRRFP
jgi:hypothetical protein